MTRRTTVVIGVVCVLGLTVPALAGCSSSGAATGPATGSVTCNDITGSANFSPPLTLAGSAPDTLTIHLVSTGCTTSGSDVSKIVSGTASTTNTSGTSSCVGLITSRPITVTIHWDPSTIEPSVVSFGGYSEDLAGGTGLLFPGTGHSVKVTGSFAGADHGSGSSAKIFTTANETELLGACQSTAGLPSLPVSSGTLTLK